MRYSLAAIFLMLAGVLQAGTPIAEYSTLLSSSNGVHRVELGIAPLNYYDGSILKQIDSTLESDNVDGFTIKADRQPIRIKVDNTGKRRVYLSTSAYFDIGQIQYKNLSNNWINLPIDSISRSGNKITILHSLYQIIITNTALKLKMDIVISSSTALRPLRMAYSASGCSISGNDEASAWIVEGGGRAIAIEKPYIFRDGTGDLAAPRALSFTRTASYIYITADVSGLTLPIYIDPSVVYSTQPSSNQDTKLSYSAPDNNYGGATYTTAGSTTSADYKSNVALIKFDLTALSGKTILGATFYVYSNDSGWRDRGSIRSWRVLAANNGWVAGTADGTPVDGTSCWDYKLRATTGWAGTACHIVGADVSTAPMGGSVVVGNFNWTGGEEIIYPITTGEFNSLLAANYGVIFTQPNNSGYFHFSTSEHATAAYRPKLVVEYFEAAAAAASAPPFVLMLGD